MAKPTLANRVLTDFGQTDFGQFFDRLWPIVVLTDFGQTDFGQFFDRLWPILVFWSDQLGPNRLWPILVSVLVFYPSGPNPSGLHPSGPHPSGPPPSVVQKFNIQNFGRSQNWPKSKLAELDRARQNTHSHDTFAHVQRITERTAQMFHSRNTRGSRIAHCVQQNEKAGDAFTHTGLMPAFRVLTGLHVKHRRCFT